MCGAKKNLYPKVVCYGGGGEVAIKSDGPTMITTRNLVLLLLFRISMTRISQINIGIS